MLASPRAPWCVQVRFLPSDRGGSIGEGRKVLQPMGAVGNLSTLVAFVWGAFVVVPWVRGTAQPPDVWLIRDAAALAEQPPMAWVIVAVVLFLVAERLGRVLDFVVRAFMDGYRRGTPSED